MINVLTSCIQRELYLSRLVDSLVRSGGLDDVDFEWYIVFQEKAPSEKMMKKLESLSFYNKIRLKYNDKPIGIGVIIEGFKRKASHPFYMKLDDDALICTPDFLKRCLEVGELIPDSVIYPLEIGGYTNIQAPLSKRQVIYGEKSNYFYSVSHAVLPTALAVLAPMKFINSFTFPPGQTDAQFIWAQSFRQNYPIFQLQNGIIVEHQESNEGQYHRKQMENGQAW